jgi:hypothetical protein
VKRPSSRGARRRRPGGGTDSLMRWRTSGLPRVTAGSFAAGVCSAGRIVGSARGPPGEGIAGAPAHIIAFQPSHMQPVGLTDFRLGAGWRGSRVRIGWRSARSISDLGRLVFLCSGLAFCCNTHQSCWRDN